MVLKSALFSLIALLVIAFSACKEADESTHMAKMDEMKDSIFKAYPTVAAVTMNVQNETLLIITLGDKHLYKATDAGKQKTAIDLGLMTLRIFGNDNSFNKGKLIVTPNERNDKAEPEDGIVTMINIDSLKDVMKKK